MTSQHKTSKRWRPRIRLRTILIVVALVGAYLACWEPTASDGVLDVASRSYPGFSHGSSPLPLVVGIDDHDVEFDGNGLAIYVGSPSRIYYIWFFGNTIRLPGEYPPVNWHPPARRTASGQLMPVTNLPTRP